MNFIYSVNEEEKTVVCTITSIEQLKTIYREVRRATVDFSPCCDGFSNGLSMSNVMNILKKYDYHLSASVGKAVAYGDDKFDLETGKRIARRKALDKYYNKRRKIIRLVICEFNRALFNLEDKIRPLVPERNEAFFTSILTTDERKNINNLFKECNKEE